MKKMKSEKKRKKKASREKNKDLLNKETLKDPIQQIQQILAYPAELGNKLRWYDHILICMVCMFVVDSQSAKLLVVVFKNITKIQK